MVSATTASSRPVNKIPALEQGDPLVPRLLIGARLRDLREAAGVPRERAARAIRASGSKITRIELGRTGLRQGDVTGLLTLYGVDDGAERSTLLALAEQTNARPWWYEHRDVVPHRLRPYLSAEESARLLRCFTDRYIPDLLRTDDYAREIIFREEPEPRAARRLELLARRRRILRRRPRPVNLWVVLDEAVLWHPVGDAATMREQLEHLTEICWRPNVTVQIAPYNICRRVPIDGPLTLVRFPQSSLPDMVHLERGPASRHPGGRDGSQHHWHIFNTLVVEAAPPERTPEIIERVLAEY